MGFKRYTANCTAEFILYLTMPNGLDVKLKFAGKDIFTRQRFIDVEDPVLQEQLEKHDLFGKYFELSKIKYTEEAAPAPSTELKISFKSVEEAKNWLHANKGVPYKALINKAKVIEKFDELGISYDFTID